MGFQTKEEHFVKKRLYLWAFFTIEIASYWNLEKYVFIKVQSAKKKMYSLN